MKKILIIFTLMFMLTGCGSETIVNLNFLEHDFSLLPDTISNCTDEQKLYYEYNNQKIYLVCLNEINLKQDDASNILDINTLKDYFEYLEILNSNNTIVVYLNNNISQDEIDIIKDKIDNYENIVKPSIFKSKEEWKTEMSESSDRISEILNESNGNPLSDTIEVKVKSLNLIEETANYIEKIDKVDRVQYSQTLTSENVEFIDNIISNNETRKIQNFDDGVATLYRFDNLSIISCNNNNVYIGTKELSYNDSFCK